MTIQVYGRHSENIPHGESYIIRDGKKYHAFQTIYGVTFRETFDTLQEAGKHLNK